ncbi:MotA/TolQ/ExbB proton channel family protein [Endozoicomonadaceae bacterium StTr2]
MIKQILVSTLLIASGVQAADPAPLQLDGLLKDVRQFSAEDRQLNKQREQLFSNDLNQQQQLLNKSRQRLEQAEREQARLKAAFDANDTKLAEMQALIQQRSGQLGEVFGVAKEQAGELRSFLSDSLTGADNPGRSKTLAFADSNRVPTLNELKNLWYQLQLEMTESGKISRFDSPVIANDGSTATQPVVRFGMFAAATEQGQFLGWNATEQALTVLPTQPEDANQQVEEYLQGSANNITVDPTRGQLFQMLDREPTVLERIQQGGKVGYLILALGAIGLLVALLQITMMLVNDIKVRKQLANPEPLTRDNPLGRVLLAVKEQSLTADQREVKVDEAILQEMPLFERGQSFVRLLSAVAPLLGLLGTVTGMIATFQSITLFGTSDPKLMAGGISQALMTTVLGLVVAIPLLFCHSYLASRSRRLMQILQERGLGLLVDAERKAKVGGVTRHAA